MGQMVIAETHPSSSPKSQLQLPPISSFARNPTGIAEAPVFQGGHGVLGPPARSLPMGSTYTERFSRYVLIRGAIL